MARSKSSQTLAMESSLSVPHLTIEEGRSQLPALSKRARSLRRASESLLERAVVVGPHRTGGLVIIPEVDAVDAVERLEEAEREKAELEEQLEDFGIFLLAQERLAATTPAEELIPIEDIIRDHGFEELLS